MLPIGVMQGRLVPREEGRFQSFPAQRWRDEFANARAAGIACIEWIYEEPNEDKNPLRTDEGLAEMRRLSAETGVNVWSICADYYMTRRIVTAEGKADNGAVEHLSWLLERAAKLGATYVVIPFVDSSSLKTQIERDAMPGALGCLLPKAAKLGVELHLETDLPPEAFTALLERVGHSHLKANYDIGNSASLGFDPGVELTLLGPWLGSVHVKDRKRRGGTVPLGTGDADLPTALRKIRDANFARWFILQVARGEEGKEVPWCVSSREYVEHLWRAVGGA